MLKEADVLKIPEKMVTQDMMNYADSVKQLVEYKKKEFEAIQGKITLYKTQLITLENRLKSMQSDFDSKMAQDKTKFEKEKNAKLNDLYVRDDLLKKGEADLMHRTASVEARETEIEKARVEKENLIKERLKFESLNREAQIQLQQATSAKDDAVAKLNLASEQDAQIQKNLKEIQNLKSIMDRQEEELKIKQNKLDEQVKNLEVLRNEVNPKIEQYNELIKKNETLLDDIKKRELDILNKKNEVDKAFERLVSKGNEQKQKDIELKTKEEELLRKEILFKK